MSNTQTAISWAVAKLLADATVAATVGTRVYALRASPNAEVPYYIVEPYTQADDTMVVGAYRIKSDVPLIIKLVFEGTDTYNYQSTQNAADAALHRSRGTIDGKTVIACVRRREILYTEVDEGREYTHFGGIYDVMTQ